MHRRGRDPSYGGERVVPGGVPGGVRRDGQRPPARATAYTSVNGRPRALQPYEKGEAQDAGGGGGADTRAAEGARHSLQYGDAAPRGVAYGAAGGGAPGGVEDAQPLRGDHDVGGEEGLSF